MRRALGLAFVGLVATSAVNAASIQITSSQALAVSERRLCRLPKDAKLVMRSVISSDKNIPPFLAVAPSGGYWVLRFRYYLPVKHDILDGWVAMPKADGVPGRCILQLPPETKVLPSPKNSN